MSIQNISFKNRNGEQLAGRLELPLDQKAHNFAILAHCFTCTKNLTAIVNLSQALMRDGFGVLSFDFTGLGQSEGDFENTNFSGNVEDLVEAANFLKQNYNAPSLIIGHSLGGTAALLAADRISSIKAVAVIGAPSDPAHVMHLLKDSESEIIKKGKATVHLEGRDFTIKKQFIDDLKSNSLSEVLKTFRKALLILHSPQDKTVDIKNAEDIFVAAHHPKSFISLDGADHLLSNKTDSHYVGRVIADWATRYVPVPILQPVDTKSKVAASLGGDEKFSTDLKLGNHSLIADEPTSVGGNDYGPSPYDYIAGGLAACTAMTIQMYARRKKWEVENVTVHISYSRTHAVDCESCEDEHAKIDTFSVDINLEGSLSEEQTNRLLEIAEKCPVHKTLTSKIRIITKILDNKD